MFSVYKVDNLQIVILKQYSFEMHLLFNLSDMKHPQIEKCKISGNTEKEGKSTRDHCDSFLYMAK